MKIPTALFLLCYLVDNIVTFLNLKQIIAKTRSDACIPELSLLLLSKVCPIA